MKKFLLVTSVLIIAMLSIDRKTSYTIDILTANIDALASDEFGGYKQGYVSQTKNHTVWSWTPYGWSGNVIKINCCVSSNPDTACNYNAHDNRC